RITDHDNGAGTVRDLRRRPRRDRAVGAEGGTQRSQRFGRGVRADALILAHDNWVAFTLRHLYRNDFVVEGAVLPTSSRPLMRPGRERVLFLARESTVTTVGRLGERAHRLVGEGVPQSVEGHVVDQRGIAVLHPGPGLR